ncbi:hypothetical protein Ate01nite_60440 [Actinoplanes teichomyceticus]|nr:hypothetical protein Ate01nite_60440 [Actinoplanes teichomyceticus]
MTTADPAAADIAECHLDHHPAATDLTRENPTPDRTDTDRRARNSARSPR